MKIRSHVIIINFITILMLAFTKVDILFAIGLLLWVNIFVYSLGDTGNRSMLLAFTIAFFTFLMGRDFVQQVFSYQVECFDIEINQHLYICIILSLISLMCGYFFCNRNNWRFNFSRHISVEQELQSEASIDPIVKNLSKILFFVSWVFAVVAKIVVASFVSSYGYFEYYTDFSEYLTGNTVLYIISKLEGVMPVALCIFSATLPSKKEYMIPSLMYVVYMLVSLATGQRSVFILGILFLMVYFLYRNKRNPEEGWFTKKMVVATIISVPLIAVLMSILANVRMGETAQTIPVIDGIFSFLYDQGVTGNVIKRAFMYRDQIPEQIYSLEFLHSGIFARLFNITVYHGNTVEHALYGGSFTHALGYVTLGNSYLAGRGTGSSYVAELFYDFGYIGVVIGNIIYGYIIAHINHPVTKNNVFFMSVRYYIITQILWAPRASLTGFLGNLFAPLTILSFLFVFGLAKLLKERYRGVSISTNE